MVRISNLDILKILMENSRVPFLKIAKIFGVSETAVRKRVRKMEENGIIRRYTVDVDPKKIGFKVNTIIGVDTEPEYYLSTIEKMKGMDEVVRLYSSSGDHMILAECWFRDSSDLNEFVKKLSGMEGVTRVCPAIIVERIK